MRTIETDTHNYQASISTDVLNPMHTKASPADPGKNALCPRSSCVPRMPTVPGS